VTLPEPLRSDLVPQVADAPATELIADAEIVRRAVALGFDRFRVAIALGQPDLAND
jgi:hypothetical protein